MSKHHSQIGAFGNSDNRIWTLDIWVRVWPKCLIYNLDRVRIWSFYQKVWFFQTRIELDSNCCQPYSRCYIWAIDNQCQSLDAISAIHLSSLCSFSNPVVRNFFNLVLFLFFLFTHCNWLIRIGVEHYF